MKFQCGAVGTLTTDAGLFVVIGSGKLVDVSDSSLEAFPASDLARIC